MSQLSVDSGQLPVGYKQTEVGVIPEEWNIASLDNLAILSSGTTPARAQSDRYFRDGTNHWIKTTDLNNSLITECEEKVTNLALQETCLQMYPKGTVLVAMYGGFNQIGRTGILILPACVNQALVAIQTKGKKLVPEFLIAYLNYRVEYWKTVASSSRKDPNITSRDVRNFVVPLPSHKEQKLIAKALSDVDTLITSLEKLIAKKRAIKTATMQQLLTGKKRLPEFERHPNGELKGYKQTELGEVPEDWEVRELREICSYINDGTHHTPNYVDSGVPFYSVETVSDDDFSNTKFITDEEHQRLVKRCKPEKNDILMTRIGTLAKTKLIDWEVDASIYVSLALLKVKKEVNPHYVYAYTKSDQFVKDVEMRSLLHAVPKKINLDELSSVPVCLPNQPEEQIALAALLGDMDKVIGTLSSRLTKTQQLKQGMMQELLTGRTRLI